MGYGIGFSGHDIWANLHGAIHKHVDLLPCAGKDTEGGRSAQEAAQKEMGRLGEEGSMLHVSWYLLGSGNEFIRLYLPIHVERQEKA